MVRHVSHHWNTLYPSLLRLAEKLEELKVFDVEIQEIVVLEFKGDLI